MGWQRKFSPHFVAVIEKSDTGPHGAVVVGKNLFPKATDRNALKRKLRNILVKVFLTRDDFTIVLYAKKQSKLATTEELTSALVRLLPL